MIEPISLAKPAIYGDQPEVLWPLNHILNGGDTLDKVTAEHRHYGAPVMLVLEDSGRFMTVSHNEKTGCNNLDQIFRVENMYGY